MYRSLNKSVSGNRFIAMAGSTTILLLWVMLIIPRVSAQPVAAGDPKVLIGATDRHYTSPVWSPQGDAIAFTSDHFNGIWIAAADGSNLRLLTADEGAGFRFSWSPDGRHILARTTGTENRRRFARIQIYDVNTRTYQILQDKTRNIQGLPLWSYDGAFATWVYNGQPVIQPAPGKEQQTPSAGLWVPYSVGGKLSAYSPATRNSKLIAEFSERIIFNISPAPSGERVAFQVQGKGLYVADMDGSNLLHLGFGEMAAWMPGEQFAVVSVVEDDGYSITGAELYAVDMKTGASFALTAHTGVIALNPHVSPCGKWVVFNDANGVIYRMALQ